MKTLTLSQRIQLRELNLKALTIRADANKDDDKWITTETGSHILIDKDGIIQGGAGGKFTGQHLSSMDKANIESEGNIGAVTLKQRLQNFHDKTAPKLLAKMTDSEKQALVRHYESQFPLFHDKIATGFSKKMKENLNKKLEYMRDQARKQIASASNNAITDSDQIQINNARNKIALENQQKIESNRKEQTNIFKVPAKTKEEIAQQKQDIENNKHDTASVLTSAERKRLDNASSNEKANIIFSAARRIMKDNGFIIDHTSKENGEISSQYFSKLTNNGIFTIRVSNHELPETEMRSSNRAHGIGGKWNKQLIIDNNDINLKEEIEEINRAFELYQKSH